MRLALISDIHANLQAFEAVLADVRLQKVSKIFCLGDIVGYGPQPEEVTNLLLSKKIPGPKNRGFLIANFVSNSFIKLLLDS